MSTEIKTTDVGYINRNHQAVLRKTSWLGNDHNQRVYVLRCLNPECGHEYGVNGSDIFQRKCPSCQGGKPGLPIQRSSTPAEVLAEIAALSEERAGEPVAVVDRDAASYGDPYASD